VSHAQIIEFARRKDGYFDLLLYTSTDIDIAEKIRNGIKSRLNPLVPFERIPEQTLLFNGDGQVRPTFIASLAEPQVLMNQDRNRKVGNEEVMQVLDFIYQYRPQQPQTDCGFITGQRGGTCSPSVTKAWMRRHCSNLSFYKQVMFHCKMQLLSACFLSLEPVLENDTEEASKARMALRMVARNLHRTSGKMIQAKMGISTLVDAPTAMQALATAQDILAKLDCCEATLNKKRELLTVGSDLNALDTADQRSWRQKMVNQPIPLLAAQSPVPITVPNLTLKLDQSVSPCEALKRLISETATCILTILNSHRIAQPDEMTQHLIRSINLQIHQLIDQIPLPKIGSVKRGDSFLAEQIEAEFWKEFTTEQLEEVQKELYSLVYSHYIRKYHFKIDPQSRCIATLLPFQVLMHFLAIKIEAKRLKTVPHIRDRLIENYAMPSFLGVLCINGLQFFERSEFERIIQAESYTRTFNRSAPIEHVIFGSEVKTSVNLAVITECPANSLYWNALYQTDKELEKNVNLTAEMIYPEVNINAEYAAMASDYDIAMKELQKWEEERAEYEATLLYRKQVDLWQKGLGPAPQHTTAPLRDQLRKKPAKPVQAIEKRNLPSSTKAMLILGSFYSSENNILTDNGYGYADILRHTTHFCRHTLYYWDIDLQDRNPNLLRTGLQLSPYKLDAILTGPKDELQGPSVRFAKQIWKKWHRPLEDSHRHFLGKNEADRLQKLWQLETGEGRALRDTAESNPLLKLLLRPLSQWRLLPDQIFYELSR
ncbi:MAG: hypothetical protein LLG04_13160, partial [Parachlamydia sp.]|nr:hypothetical protein [Parachlamydia sp.]